MHETGIIWSSLDWRARALLFRPIADEEVARELPHLTEIDRAHVVMLVEQALVPHETGARLLSAIAGLRRQDYAPLRGRPAPRGLYLSYEQWLIETLGEQVGGAAHLGRSRNDINATVVLLRLRPAYIRLVRELLRLLAVLIRQSERYATLTMPVYTQQQPALPGTYGHYLAGVALALVRDLWGIEIACADDRCPLGAGAAAGTTVPIDPRRTARLLGFSEGVLHAIDAVASRDQVLRLLGAASVTGVTLSRLASDLQLWSTAEFDLVRFPDSLVGSSSMMPQKRNPFLLEHVQGRAGAPIGAFTAATMAMHAMPFSNAVAVSTEGVAPVWTAVDRLTDAVVLTRLAVTGARPQSDTMHRRAREGYTAATELANWLVREGGLSFRQAHHRVGQAIRDAIARGVPFETLAGDLLRGHGVSSEPSWFDPSAIAARTVSGGGPGAASTRRVLVDLRRQWTEAARRLRARRQAWERGARLLDAAEAAVQHGESHPSGTPGRSVSDDGSRKDAASIQADQASVSPLDRLSVNESLAGASPARRDTVFDGTEPPIAAGLDRRS